MLDGSFHQKELRSISFEPEDNPEVRRLYSSDVGSKNGDFVIRVPDYVDATHLVPTVEFDGHAVSFNGTPWTVGQSVDFTTLTSIEVAGKDEETHGYTVTVEFVPAQTDKRLNGFRIAYPIADDLDEDPERWVPHTVVDDDDLWSVNHAEFGPSLNGVQYLLVEFDFTGLRLELDGEVVRGRLLGFDFSVPHTYSVVAEDLSTKTGTLRVQLEPNLRGSIIAPGLTYRSVDTEYYPNRTYTFPAGTNLAALQIYHWEPFYDENDVYYPGGQQAMDFTSPRTLRALSTYTSRPFTFVVSVAP